MSDSQRTDGVPTCGECVIHLIAGASYYPCALPKGHAEKGHRAGGTCFAHGPFLGEIGRPPCCPKWPDCIKSAQAADVTPVPPLSIEGRDEFEKWAKAVEGDGIDGFVADFTRVTPPKKPKWKVADEYCSDEIQAAWLAWQASRASDRERVKELERFRERAYLNHTEATDHTTGCLIWGEDGQGAVPEAWEKAYKGGLPCSCGALTNFERKRSESAESRVAELQRELEFVRGANGDYADMIVDMNAALAERDGRLSTLIGLLTRAEVVVVLLDSLLSLLRHRAGITTWGGVGMCEQSDCDHAIGEARKLQAAIRSHLESQ